MGSTSKSATTLGDRVEISTLFRLVLAPQANRVPKFGIALAWLAHCNERLEEIFQVIRTAKCITILRLRALRYFA